MGHTRKVPVVLAAPSWSSHLRAPTDHCGGGIRVCLARTLWTETFDHFAEDVQMGVDYNSKARARQGTDVCRDFSRY